MMAAAHASGLSRAEDAIGPVLRLAPVPALSASSTEAPLALWSLDFLVRLDRLRQCDGAEIIGEDDGKRIEGWV
jgi:hypothetical protein